MTPDAKNSQDQAGSAAAERDYSHAWRALRHRNFRLFFGGQSISLIGTWMTRIATSWLVYRLTKSALLLGTVSFAGQIPTFLLAPIAGVIVDRIDRRKVLVWTQTLAMVQSLAAGVADPVASDHHREVLALSAMQGIINAFDMPGRQSFMVKMVEESRRSVECHRHQFVDGQHGAADRALAGRIADCSDQRGLVLPGGWHQLHRRDCLATDDASGAERRSSVRRHR